MAQDNAPVFIPHNRARHVFTNTDGNQVELTVELGAKQSQNGTLTIVGKDGGIRKESTWEELVQLHTLLTEVLNFPPHPHVGNHILAEWIEEEINLAMKQELLYRGTDDLRRHGVAKVRARRILAKLDGFHVPDMETIQDVAVQDAILAR